MAICKPGRGILTLLASRFQISSLQNGEKTNSYCLSYSIYGILLWQLELTNTVLQIKMAASVGSGKQLGSGRIYKVDLIEFLDKQEGGQLDKQLSSENVEFEMSSRS